MQGRLSRLDGIVDSEGGRPVEVRAVLDQEAGDLREPSSRGEVERRESILVPNLRIQPFSRRRETSSGRSPYTA